MDANAITKVQAYLNASLKTSGLKCVARKQKDSAEVMMGDEFIGVVYEDEDEPGSYLFEMAILKEDL
jgi:hypothetical protein